MRDKPNIRDERLVFALETAYGVTVEGLSFLPMGNDAAASVYRVRGDGDDYFLKVRAGMPNRAALAVPHYLRAAGVDSVVAPFATADGELYATVDGYSLILYPWIRGESKWGKAIHARQWRAWGRMTRAIHEVEISAELLALLPREQYGRRWIDRLKRVELALGRASVRHDIAARMAELWGKMSGEIELARERYIALGARLRARGPRSVICHGDMHAANIMVDGRGAIHIVDWDETVLAPRERDLMFFLVDGHPRESVLAFVEGYGEPEADSVGLAYYRYDWVLQEFCDYGERVFVTNGLSEQELGFSYDEFRRLFAEGDVLDLARQAYAMVDG